MQPSPGVAASPGTPPTGGGKSFIATWLLAWLVGGLGVDRFYLGKIGTGLLKLFTFGGLGVWWLIDLILVFAGATRDSAGRPLKGYAKHRTAAWIVTAAFVALSVIIGSVNGAAAGGGSTAEPETDDAAAVIEEPAEAAAPADITEEPGDDPAPEPEPADGAASTDWADSTFGTFEPVQASGSGDDLVALPADATGGLVTFTHEGSGHAAVTVLDAANESTGELLVNTIGAYTGATAWGISAFGDGVTLQVTASGPWSLSVEPMAAADELGDGASGSGDAVFLYGGDAGSLAISNDGAGHFAVAQHTDAMFEFGLLVNEVGPYEGTVPASAGPSVITVTSDGAWSLTVS